MRQARREFGFTLRNREETRSAWQMRGLEDLGSDLRYAARALRRNRALTLAAVGSLALGIGANTTIFSVAREALFSEPSCRDAKPLVQISVSGSAWIPISAFADAIRPRKLSLRHLHPLTNGLHIDGLRPDPLQFDFDFRWAAICRGSFFSLPAILIPEDGSTRREIGRPSSGCF